MSKSTENKRRREKRRKKNDQNLNKNKLLRFTIKLLEESLENLRNANDKLACEAGYYQMIKLAVKVKEMQLAKKVEVNVRSESPNILLGQERRNYNRDDRLDFTARQIAYCPPGNLTYLHLIHDLQFQERFFIDHMVGQLATAISRDILIRLLNETRVS